MLTFNLTRPHEEIHLSLHPGELLWTLAGKPTRSEDDTHQSNWPRPVKQTNDTRLSDRNTGPRWKVLHPQAWSHGHVLAARAKDTNAPWWWIEWGCHVRYLNTTVYYPLLQLNKNSNMALNIFSSNYFKRLKKHSWIRIFPSFLQWKLWFPLGDKCPPYGALLSQNQLKAVLVTNKYINTSFKTFLQLALIRLKIPQMQFQHLVRYDLQICI